MSEMLYELCDILMQEVGTALEKIRNAGGKLTSGDVEYIDRLTHALKSVKSTIMLMENEGGQSNDSYRSYDDRSYRGSYDGDMGGDSYARGRSQRTGRYVSREAGYSGHEDYAKTLETMLRQTGDPKKQEAIREALSALQSR